jgi:hypothetical protein
MTCAYAHLDGSYVLGALAPGERLEFEQHLTGCPSCARAVRELAGLPGLLARVEPETLEGDTSDPPLPDTLLPALVGEVRRAGRRRTVVTALLSAAAVVVAVAGLLAVGVLGDGTPDSRPAAVPSATSSAGRDMLPVVAGPVRASVDLVSVPWGTRLDLTCTYDATAYHDGHGQPDSYVLVVRTRDGGTEQVATWRALPGRTMQLSAATAARRADIASVEVRTPDGHPVLRLST